MDLDFLKNKEEYSFLSYNGEQTIFYYIYYPEDGKYKGIVQISHGMNEHMGRYKEFIAFLCSNGFIVCGNDHAGHGKSCDKIKGYMGKKDGSKALICDMYRVYKDLRKQYPGLPYFMLGHSMGSFLLRKYIEEYSHQLDGILLTGTGNSDFPMNIVYPMGIFISKMMIKVKGIYSYGKFFELLSFGMYRRHFAPMRTIADWQTRDPEKVDAFLNDKRCRFTFTYAGYRDILGLILDVSKKGKVYRNKQLPIFLFSGDDDPVGMYGRSVINVFGNFKEAGMEQVYCKLYEGGRHEMLNEINRQEVYEDILEFLNNVLNHNL